MTVPPTPPPRPSDERARHHAPTSREHGTAPDTPPTVAGQDRSDTPISAPAPEHTQPAAPAPAPGPAYLSGIVTAGLAAICGAIFTSWAGVQGTLVGAMVGATIGSTVSEVVRAPLDALERRIIAAGVSPWRVRRDGVVKTVMTSPTAAQQAFGMVSRGAVLTVGATAIVGFLLAVGGVTAVERASGQPLAATLGGDSQETTGTTIGSVVPNPPAALAPIPTAPIAQTTARTSDETVAGRSGGGMTAYPPTVPPRQDVPPAAPPATLPSPASGLLPGPASSPEPDQDTLAAAPAASPSPDAALAEAARSTTVPGTPPPDGSPAVQVVTVVVTATPTPGETSGASAPTTDQTPTPTATPTRTPTEPPGASTPSGSPVSPPPPPQT